MEEYTAVIRRKRIVDLGACECGVEYYDAFCKVLGQWVVDEDEQVLQIPWSPYAMLLALTNAEAKPWATWVIHNGLLPMWSLAEQDLRCADLIGANLIGANLSDADLRGADLSDADLSDANLIGANLRGAYYPTGDVPAGWQRVNDRLQRAA